MTQANGVSVEDMQRNLGNAEVARLFESNAMGVRRAKGQDGGASAAGALAVTFGSDRPARLQRQPTAVDEKEAAPPGESQRAETIISAKYPHLYSVLDAQDVKAVQAVIDWRLERQRLNEQINLFDLREREKARREGKSGDSYKYLSSYNDKLDRLQNKAKDPPKKLQIEVDTSKLIDRAILQPQEWNIDAQREFREKWVLALAGKPAIIDLSGSYAIEEGFRGLFWNGVRLPTEGGLITWKSLLDIPGVWRDYNTNVDHSPLANAADQAISQLRHWHDIGESEFEDERERKENAPRMFRIIGPKVSTVSEFLSSEIDWKAAEKLLPKGKKFEDMDPFEIMRFIQDLKPQQLDRISRVLPGEAEREKVRRHVNNLHMAVAQGKYEAALMVAPIVADEVEEMIRKVRSYYQRTMEGASTAIAGLQAVRVACNIVLTVGGGVAGKAYGLIGVSAGSAAGAATGTFTQEGAMQVSSGQFDAKALMAKTGKDAIVTFLGSMLGGALASRFQAALNLRLAATIPNETVRMFAVSRLSDIGTGLITQPLNIAVDGMLEGKWPENWGDFAEKMAIGIATDMALGSTVEAVTGMKSLKDKTWDEVTPADIAGAPRPEAPSGPQKTGPAGEPATAGKTSEAAPAMRDPAAVAREALAYARQLSEAAHAGGSARPQAQPGAAGSGAIRPEAVSDVRFYGDALLNQGFGYTSGKVQGTIAPDGHWQAVDTSGVKPLPADAVDRVIAVREHQKAVGEESGRMQAILATESRPTAGEGSVSSGVPEPIAGTETTGVAGPKAGEGPPSSGVPEPIAGTETTGVAGPKAGEGPQSSGVPEPIAGTETTGVAGPKAGAGPQSSGVPEPIAGTATTGTAPTGPRPNEAKPGPDDTQVSERKDIAGPEEKTQTAVPLAPHPHQLTGDEVTGFVAQILRRPVTPVEVRFYGSEADFQNTMKGKWPDLQNAQNILAYYDPDTQLLHLGPRAGMSSVLHETIHKVAADTFPHNRGLIGDYVDEGITEWLARRRLPGIPGEGSAYNKHVEFVEYLASKVGLEPLENMLLHGQYAKFRAALKEVLGGREGRVYEFMRIMRSMDRMGDSVVERRLREMLGD